LPNNTRTTSEIVLVQKSNGYYGTHCMLQKLSLSKNQMATMAHTACYRPGPTAEL